MKVQELIKILLNLDQEKEIGIGNTSVNEDGEAKNEDDEVINGIYTNEDGSYYV